MEASLNKGVRHLVFDDFAAGRALHAALLAASPRRQLVVSSLHDHDFYEMLLVLAGEARHELNGSVQTLRGGDLLFLRPPDRHSLIVPAGGALQHINIAFPAGAWRQFRALSGVEADDWEASPMPPTVALPDETARERGTAVFQEALHAYQRPASPGMWLELWRFLAGALPFLSGGNFGEDRGNVPDAPEWLAQACRALRRDPGALRAGVPGLLRRAGVSPSHLARTLRAATGRTPTEYVTELRLERAALLLATGTLPIVEIAAECGFGQLSYFYRRFAQRYGVAPNAYRQRTRRSVAP